MPVFALCARHETVMSCFCYDRRFGERFDVFSDVGSYLRGTLATMTAEAASSGLLSAQALHWHPIADFKSCAYLSLALAAA